MRKCPLRKRRTQVLSAPLTHKTTSWPRWWSVFSVPQWSMLQVLCNSSRLLSRLKIAQKFFHWNERPEVGLPLGMVLVFSMGSLNKEIAVVVCFPLFKLSAHFSVPKEIRWPQPTQHSSSSLKADSVMALLSLWLALQSESCYKCNHGSRL